MSQLDQKTKVHGGKEEMLMLDTQPRTGGNSEGGYQPLYKTAEFKANLVKPPKPFNCLQPFTIRVLYLMIRQKFPTTVT